MTKFFLILSFLFSIFAHAQNSTKRRPLGADRFQHLSGIQKVNGPKTFWDKKYGKKSYIYGKAPAEFLARNYDYLPAGSKILDMGMGEGRNAIFLARKGHKVVGIDISSVAVKKARLLAREYGVNIQTIVASLEKYKIPEKSYDAIICFYYVDRSLHERMMKWLRPGGLLIYEAFTENQLTLLKSKRPYEKKYYIKPGELLSMFPGLRILKYEEPLHRSSFPAGLIAQKQK